MLVYYPLSGFVNAVASSSLGIIALKHNPWSALNRAFAYFSFTIALWSAFYFVWQLSDTAESAIFWCRCLMVPVIILPSTVFHFSVTLIEQRKRYSNIIKIFYVCSLYFLTMNFGPGIVDGVTPRLFFTFWPTPGWAFPYHVAMTFVCFTWSIWLMYYSLPGFNKNKQNQIRYVALGILLAFLGGITNYALWFGVPVPPVGNTLVIAFVVLSFYAIIRYKLMDIKIALTRTSILLFIYFPLLVLPYLYGYLTKNWIASATLMWFIATAGLFLIFRLESLLETQLSQKVNSPYRLAILDSLTGAYNSSFFNKTFCEDIDEARKNKQKLCLAFIDIDMFKNINSLYGHQVGDEVLRLLVKILKKTLRGDDTVYRYGGDEFLVTFIDTGIKDVVMLSKKISGIFEKNHASILRDGQDVEINATLSIGVAEMSDGDSCDTIFNRAEAALFEAKKQGGNTVVS